jgi:hypothetical protein
MTPPPSLPQRWARRCVAASAALQLDEARAARARAHAQVLAPPFPLGGADMIEVPMCEFKKCKEKAQVHSTNDEHKGPVRMRTGDSAWRA